MGQPTLFGEPGYWLSGAQAYWALVRRRIQRGPVFSWRFIGPVPERLALVPPDLRPIDPLVARDIYEGRFSFAGRTLETGGASPFAIPAPSPAWDEKLHGFRWLRHLKGAESELASANARALVRDWMQGPGRTIGGTPWTLDVTAARVISWMQYSRLLLQESDHAFYRRFMTSLARQVRYLRSLAPSMNDDLEALHVRIAIAYSAQVMPTTVRVERSAGRNLEFQLRQQILPDGGHISRNPDVLAGLLADLLPLSQCYVSASKPVPKDIINAIDRMFPALRFFRHSDGHIAMFHGAGNNDTDLIAAVLRHDPSGAQPLSHAPHSGYQRLAQGSTIIIADTGKPPRDVHAANGHASCLAFEMSSGRQRIFVNSGIDRIGRDYYREVTRATAAHSTLVVEDTSSARFARFGGSGQCRIVSGPANVRIDRESDEANPGFSAQHDGYMRRFSLWHERGITLKDDGRLVEGYDRLVHARPRSSAASEKRQFDIRFHLHPKVRPEKADASSVRLTTEQGDVWRFSANKGHVLIEESIHFAGVAGPVRTQQIVVSGDYPDIELVDWRLERATA